MPPKTLKQLEEERKKKAQTEFQRTQGLPGIDPRSARGGQRVPVGIIPTEEQQRIEQGVPEREKEIRREQFQEATGSAELKAELERKAFEQPSLAPPPITQPISTIGLMPAAVAGNLITGVLEVITGKKFGRTSAKELAETDAGKALGLATLGAAGALAAVAAAPLLAQSAATGVITKAVVSKAGILKTAVTGLGIFIVGKGVFDIQGGEIETMRKILQKMVEDGERIEAATRNGLPTGDTIELLTKMAEEISFAESRIKDLGNFNLQYRISKEYLQDQAAVRSSRLAIERRVLAVENIAATGQAALNPEQLLFIASQFEES